MPLSELSSDSAASGTLTYVQHEDRGNRMAQGLAGGRVIAERLVGLTLADAEAIMSEHADYQINFVQTGSAMTYDLRSNRVRAFMEDGVVVRATAG